MPILKGQQKVYEYVCQEILVHGITGKKRKCGKVIRSFYKGQFEFWKAEHLAKHTAKKKNVKTLQVLAKVK